MLPINCINNLLMQKKTFRNILYGTNIFFGASKLFCKATRSLINKMFQLWLGLNTKHKDEFDKKYLKNIFNTRFNKNVLVSFITNPYLFPDHYYYHSNREECKVICQIFNRLHYNVDLVEFDYRGVQFARPYDLLFGYGEPLEEYIRAYPKKDYKIFLYRNGTDDSFADEQSIIRLKSVYNETGYILADSVLVFHLKFKLQLAFADKIIALGNNFVKETFEKYANAQIFSLDLMYNDIGSIDIRAKDLFASKNNFLWFGSKGAIHKGLDLCVQYFSEHQNINLYIAGFNEEEFHFKEAYNYKLFSKNIFNIGFVRMDHPDFKKLMNNCAAVIFPTISEGGAGAVLNVIAAGGLIPIVPKSIGLDFKDFEIIIQDLTIEGIHTAVTEYLSIPVDNLIDMSIKVQAYIREKHTKEEYEKRLYQLITIS